MIENINEIFLLIGNSNYSLVVLKNSKLSIDSKKWIVKLHIQTGGIFYDFYLVKDDFIPELPEETIWEYRTVRTLFTRLCLAPDLNDEMLLINERGAEWAFGSFFDLYLYNYFDSEKVQNFTNRWEIKNDNIPKFKFKSSILKYVEYDELEQVSNAKFEGGTRS